MLRILSLSGVNDVSKLGLERGASDQESVNILLLGYRKN